MPAPARKPRPVAAAPAVLPELAHFGALAGQWYAEGEVHASAHGPAGHWSSDERYEWLPGERFLVNHWDARVGEREFKGMAVLGHDAARGYFAAFYDNAGHSPVYRMSIDGRRFYFDGERQRAEYQLAADGGSMKISWQVRDGAAWRPLCDLVATRRA